MDILLYLLALAAIQLIRLLPLPVVARLGRAGGMLFYWFDARHRRVALRNLNRCFSSVISAKEIHGLARENFRRIGENFASAVKTSFMSPADLKPYFEFVGAEKIAAFEHHPPQSRIVAIGHFGNFELYARFGQFVPFFKCATTYRGLRQPGLDRLMKSLRERSGCYFYERRGDASVLKEAMSDTGLLLGLLADQHAGDNGARLPFLGHECSTSTAPAIFALRYGCPLHTAICYRVKLAHWRIEVGDEIPTHSHGEARPIEEICTDINRAFEEAIRRDAANWFWVHNRWKLAKSKRHKRRAAPISAELA